MVKQEVKVEEVKVADGVPLPAKDTTTPGNTLKAAWTYLFTWSGQTRAQVVSNTLGPHLAWLLFQSGLAGAVGAVSGAWMASRSRALVFLAINAHRLPRTVGGWYYYHRTKQLECILAAGPGALQYGGQFAALALGFGLVEQGFERWDTPSPLGRSGEAWYNTLASGIVLSSAASIIYSLPRQYAKYALLFGTSTSLIIGILQDIYGMSTGHSCKYPSHIHRGFWLPGMGYISLTSPSPITPRPIETELQTQS